jgi:UDP-glucose 4-epimerase
MTPREFDGPVLVTGGQGQLGRLLVASLRTDGVRTVSVGRRAGVDPDDVRVDLSDSEAVAGIVRAVDPALIVHLAAALSGDDLQEQSLLIDRAVAAAACQSGTPYVIHTSSAAVYGTENEAARQEADPLTGTSLYARSKITGEEVFRALAFDGGTQVTTLRLFNLAGPAFPDSLVMRLVTATPAAPASLIAPDRFQRDYVHQSDAIAILRSAFTARPERYQVLNVGAGVAVTTRALVEDLEIAEDRFIELPGGPNSSWADVTRMTAVLGIRPQSGPTVHWAEPVLPGTGA